MTLYTSMLFFQRYYKIPRAYDYYYCHFLYMMRSGPVLTKNKSSFRHAFSVSYSLVPTRFDVGIAINN